MLLPLFFLTGLGVLLIEVLDVVGGNEGSHLRLERAAVVLHELVRDDNREHMVVVHFTVVGNDECEYPILPYFLDGEEDLQRLLGTVVEPLLEGEGVGECLAVGCLLHVEPVVLVANESSKEVCGRESQMAGVEDRNRNRPRHLIIYIIGGIGEALEFHEGVFADKDAALERFQFVGLRRDAVAGRCGKDVFARPFLDGRLRESEDEVVLGGKDESNERLVGLQPVHLVVLVVERDGERNGIWQVSEVIWTSLAEEHLVVGHLGLSQLTAFLEIIAEITLHEVHDEGLPPCGLPHLCVKEVQVLGRGWKDQGAKADAQKHKAKGGLPAYQIYYAVTLIFHFSFFHFSRFISLAPTGKVGEGPFTFQ